MYSEVLVVSELSENCVRDRSDAHLEACTVVDEGCAMLSDRDLDFVRVAEMSRLERLVSFHEDVDHVHRDHCVTPCARYVRIDYGDDCLCAFYGREGCVYRRSERYISMLVRRAYLDHCDVAAECSASVQLLRLAEEYRDVVRISGLDALAHVSSDEERLVEEDSAEFRICVRRCAFCVEMVDAHILKLSCLTSSAKCLDEETWGACNAAQMNMVARFYDLYGFVSRYESDLFTHNYVIILPKIVIFCRIATFA